MRHQFLMEGLLSLSASHCAHLEPLASWDYTEAATKYQISGILGYRSALNCIDGNNYEAVFAFSIILIIMGFGMPSASQERQSVTPLDHITSIFELLKGVEITTQTYGEMIKFGMFKPLFLTVNTHSVDNGQQGFAVAVPWRDAKAAMTRLRERVDIVTKYVGVDVREIYIGAIDGLELSFLEVELKGGISHVVAWPILSGKDLIDLLKRKDPMALLLWAHYGVLTLVVHNYWWGKDFGVRLIDGLCSTLHSLDPEWMIWTEWARYCASLVSRL
ncbi:hypothetical protein GCG54_00012335 [Colletotrichum gloeosporioides]|uniref:Uncharacterized protein n=1 Tax=Colletotrichum gloeosporioides TaxID=474922 RepID=A0A8H4CE49_COLGL|nr:uncharacterized protein GCG54_00012335 [Colletotrichum gloeosporioides]KAF3802089.1 hypothetical protein GCG54_00012335 [Colletotrichum gloeosporioides]